MPKLKGQPQTHKLFIRSATPPQGRRLQAGDLEIVKSVADYRYLDSQQIGLLHPRNYKNLAMRLQWLYHAGFLDRPVSQVPPIGFRPRRHIIYCLAKKGAEALAQNFPEQYGEIKWTTPKQSQESHLWHDMMITDFHVCLALALQGSSAKLAMWKDGNNVSFSIQERGGMLTIIPDGFFALEDDEFQWNYFVEADRGTMELSRFLLKLKMYRKWKNSGESEKVIGSTHFRVLTITQSEARAEHIREVAKRADETQQGSNLFLFACERQYSLTNPHAVLQPIWRSSKDNTPHRLLE